jgi:hypothetical protein
MEHICSQCKEETKLEDLERAVVDSDGREDLVCQECVALIIDGSKKLESDPLWFGYKMMNGEFYVFKYFGEDIQKSTGSVVQIERMFEPFEAKDEKDALIQVKNLDSMITKKLEGGVTDEI